MRTYRALPAPSPCRQSLAPRTWGCPPAPVAKVIHLRLVDQNRVQDRQTDRQAGRQREKRKDTGRKDTRIKKIKRTTEYITSQSTPHTPSIAFRRHPPRKDVVCGGPSSYSTEIFALCKSHPLLLFDIFMPLCSYSVRTKLVHFPLRHYAIIIITE